MVGVFGDGEPQIGISDMIGSSLREGFFFFVAIFLGTVFRRENCPLMICFQILFKK